MIENIRKYTGLMIVVLVLLFVGLVFLDGGSVARALGGKPVMEVEGQAISQKEFRRQTALIQLANAIPGGFPLPRETRLLASHYLGKEAIDNERLTAGGIIMEMSRFLQVGFPYGPTDEARFITNRRNVQKAGLKYGVTPSDAEVESFVENVLFADPEGNYDQVAYSEFLKNRVSNIGGNRGFNEYIRDLLTAQNLAKLIGGGISPEMETVRLIYDSDKQVISGQQIALEAEPYETEAEPTEEELKAFFEENQGNYQSDELRKVSYVLIAPDWDDTLKTVTEEKEKAKKLAEEKARKEAESKKKAEEAIKKANAGDPTDPAAPGNPAKETQEESTQEQDAPTEEQEAPGEESTPEKEDSPEPTEPATESSTPEGAQGEPGQEGAQAPEPTDSPESTESESTESAQTDGASGPAQPADKPTSSLVTPDKAEPGLGSDLDQLLEDANTPKLPDVSDLPKTAKEQLNSLEKRNAVEALAGEVDAFYDELVNNRGEDFDGIAEDYGYEVKTTGFFSESNPPVLFDKRVLNSRVGTLAADVFQSPTAGDPDELLSEPLQTEEGWVVFRFDDLTEAEPLSFEEARPEVLSDLKEKMGREAMIAEAKDLREKLVAALEEGKSFPEAAKALEKEPTELEELTEGQVISFGQGQSQKMPNPPAFDAAKFTNPGDIAPVEFTPSEEEANRALIIYVDKREVVKDPEYLNKLETTFQQRSRLATLITFENWLQEQYNESEVVPPKTDEQ